MEVMANFLGAAAEGTLILEQENRSNAVLVARAVEAPKQERVSLRLLNIRNKPTAVKKGTTVAQMEP